MTVVVVRSLGRVVLKPIAALQQIGPGLSLAGRGVIGHQLLGWIDGVFQGSQGQRSYEPTGGV